MTSGITGRLLFVLLPLAFCHTGAVDLRTVACLSSRFAPISNQTVEHSLDLQITTEGTRGAGTDNAVYFDVGPWSWRLNKRFRNDFERGHTDTFHLKVPEGFRLTDVIWLRLHKKGLFSVTGTGDGISGAWHPQRVRLLVDGTEYASADFSAQPLNSRYWFWTKRFAIDPYADPLSFARSLRLKPNDKLPWTAKPTGFITTPLFKKKNISGWLECPEQKENPGLEKPCGRVPQRVCASGEVFGTPARSSDGLATIDLTLDALEFCLDTGVCLQRAKLTELQDSRPRYLRVEYLHRGNRVPKKDEPVRICGELRWDTDREGWWEIHSREKTDVESLTKPK